MDPVRGLGVGLVEVGVRAGVAAVHVGGSAVHDEPIGARPDVGGDLPHLMPADQDAVRAVGELGREAAGHVRDVAVAEHVGVGRPAPLAVVGPTVVEPDGMLAVLAVEDAAVPAREVAVERDAAEAKALRAGAAAGDPHVVARHAGRGGDGRPVRAVRAALDAGERMLARAEQDRAADGGALHGGGDRPERRLLGAGGRVVAASGVDPDRVGDRERAAVVGVERERRQVVVLGRRAARAGAGAERDRAVGELGGVKRKDIFPNPCPWIGRRGVRDMDELPVDGKGNADAVLVERTDACEERSRHALVGDDVPPRNGPRRERGRGSENQHGKQGEVHVAGELPFHGICDEVCWRF